MILLILEFKKGYKWIYLHIRSRFTDVAKLMVTKGDMLGGGGGGMGKLSCDGCTAVNIKFI